MVALHSGHTAGIKPTESDVRLAGESGRRLADLLKSRRRVRVDLRNGRKGDQIVELPMPAVHLLAEILMQMSRGNAVALVPIHAELTTQEAAELLNVSRPFVIKLIEEGNLPARKVGKHRRVLYRDVLRFKQESDARRRVVLDELVADAQELNLGY